MARIVKSHVKPRRCISAPATRCPRVVINSKANANEKMVWYHLKRLGDTTLQDDHVHTIFVIIWILCIGKKCMRDELIETYELYEDSALDHFFDEVLKKWGKTFIRPDDIIRLFARRFGTEITYHYHDMVTIRVGNLAFVERPTNTNPLVNHLFGQHLPRMTKKVE